MVTCESCSGHRLALWWSSYLVCKNLPHKKANSGDMRPAILQELNLNEVLAKLTEDLMLDLTEGN